MEVQNWTLRNTQEREDRINRLRAKLKASNRKVETIHGVPTTAGIFDAALIALERELDQELANKKD